jgi:hypothetical protein
VCVLESPFSLEHDHKGYLLLLYKLLCMLDKLFAITRFAKLPWVWEGRGAWSKDRGATVRD